MKKESHKTVSIKKIKSPYILKVIFKSLSEGKKLDLIKYNLKIKNKLNIDLEK